MKTLFVILQKEFRQFRRNSFLPRIAIAFPLMVMLVMPLVTTMDVRNVNVVVVAQDEETFTRRLIGKLEASEYFTHAALVTTYAQALRMVQEGAADVIVEVPRGFEARLASSAPLALNVSANAVNGTKGSLGLAYMMNLLQEEVKSSLKSAAADVEKSPQLAVNVQHLYNPTLNYRHFMIPALMIMLLIMLCGFLPALNLVGEREKGTIEQINVTPVRPLVFTLGKLVPYWLLGVVVLTLSMLIAWLVYGLVPQGGVGVVYVAAFLFIIVMSGLGVAIANRSDTMQQVMFVMFFFVVLFILMSGLLTPLSSMPHWAQCATYVIPPRFFISIMRATYLRGASFADVAPDFLALSAYALFFALTAVATFKKQA